MARKGLHRICYKPGSPFREIVFRITQTPLNLLRSGSFRKAGGGSWDRAGPQGFFRRRNPQGRLPIRLICERFLVRGCYPVTGSGRWMVGNIEKGGGRFLPPPKVFQDDR